VHFQAGVPIARALCPTIPGSCTSTTLVRCLAPPLPPNATSPTFSLHLSVSGVASVFTGGVWTYGAPAVVTVAPGVLPPAPGHEARVTISGSNLGWRAGVVTVGAREWPCPVWSNAAVQCVPQPGVAAALPLVVVDALGRRSATPVTLSFRGPVVLAAALGSEGTSAASPTSTPTPTGTGTTATGDGNATASEEGVVGTRGGRVLVVAGADFGSPQPLTLWLVRRGGVVGPPWAPSPDVLPCPLVPGSATPASAACTVPEGSGVGWHVVAVNHDGVAGQGQGLADLPASPTSWRASTPSAYTLNFASPVVLSVSPVGAEGQAGAAPAPTSGSFALLVQGANFGGPGAVVQAWVGALPCPLAPLAPRGHDALVCLAPPWQVDQGSVVRVVVDGVGPVGTSPAVRYDPPVVQWVVPAVVFGVPVPEVGWPQVTLHGRNFGVRYRDGLPSPHVVTVDGRGCGAVVWVSDSEVRCEVDWELTVGNHTVSLTLVTLVPPSAPSNATASNASSSSTTTTTSSSGTLRAQCPVGTYGALPGERCLPCPPGALCGGLGADPVSAWGFYPLSRTVFTPCVPPGACSGGVNATVLGGAELEVGCAANYRGHRCADCRRGSYRLRSRCVPCPNTGAESVPCVCGQCVVFHVMWHVKLWPVASGPWPMACGVRRVACGVWRVACGFVWRVSR
jgi:hypothetical protein